METNLYQSLAPNYVRTLSLEDVCLIENPLTGKRDLSIQCRIQEVALEDVRNGKTSYTALSYCWGSGTSSFCRMVKCNGHVVAVTLSLFDVLWQLVSDESIGDLWVDALCINQIDQDEKFAQIQLMGDIYRQADLVIAWLGPGGDVPGDDIGKFWQWIERLPARDTHLDQKTFEMGCAYLDRCAWFQRCWTLQEIVLARKARVQCGPYHVDWDILISHFGTQHALHEIDALRQRNTGDLPLGELLQSGFRRQCHLPVDRIYSLLGMSRKTNQALRIDQTVTMRAIFARATLAVMHETGAAFFIHGSCQPIKVKLLPSTTLGKHLATPPRTFYSRLVTDMHAAQAKEFEPAIGADGWETSIYFSFPYGDVADRANTWVCDWQEMNRDRFLYLIGSGTARRPLLRAPRGIANLCMQPFLDNENIVLPGAILGVWLDEKKPGPLVQLSPEALNQGNGRFQGLPACIPADKVHGLSGPGRLSQPPKVPSYLRDEVGLYDSAKVMQALKKHSTGECPCNRKSGSKLSRKNSTGVAETPTSDRLFLLCALFGDIGLVVLKPEWESNTTFAVMRPLAHLHKHVWSRVLVGMLNHYGSLPDDQETGHRLLTGLSWVPTHFSLM